MKFFAVVAASALAAATAADTCSLIELPQVFGPELVAQVTECTTQASWNLLGMEDFPTDPTKQAAICKACGSVFPQIQAKTLPTCDLPFTGKPIPLKTLIDNVVQTCESSTGGATNGTAPNATEASGNSTPKATSGTETNVTDETKAPNATEAQKKDSTQKNSAGVLSVGAVTAAVFVVAAFFN